MAEHMRAAVILISVAALAGCLSVIGETAPAAREMMPANRAPRADAGPDLTTAPGHFVVLDAAASSDPDGDDLSYAWNVVAGAGGGLLQADEPHARFRAAMPGTYIVELTVRDAGYLLSNDIAVIDVASMRGGAGLTTFSVLVGRKRRFHHFNRYPPDRSATDGTPDLLHQRAGSAG